MPTQVRFIQEIGTQARLRRYWGGKDCPNSYGVKGRPGGHNAEHFLAASPKIGDWELGGMPEDHAEALWPAKCDDCGALVPPEAAKQVSRRRLYDSPSGSPEPGDVFWLPCYGSEGNCPWWDNCPGRHLHVVLPNGHSWDIDSRASNCQMKDDRAHRCWVRSGEPPLVTANKNGLTCGAGAGSISVPGYHGFLLNGILSDHHP